MLSFRFYVTFPTFHPLIEYEKIILVPAGIHSISSSVHADASEIPARPSDGSLDSHLCRIPENVGNLMPKVAICKIPQMADFMLVLGISENVDGEERWRMYQHYTLESYYHTNYQYDPHNDYHRELWGSQEAADEASKEMHEAAAAQKKFQGKSLFLQSIQKEIPIHWNGKHDFSMNDAEQVEITVEEKHKLDQELNESLWEAFDILDWGK